MGKEPSVYVPRTPTAIAYPSYQAATPKASAIYGLSRKPEA
jgi:hypothetical protein